MKKSMLRQLFISLLMLSFASFATAEQLRNLYDVEVVTQSQSARDLRTASREALAILFVRVSGSNDVINNPVIKSAISNAQTYMRQFQYQRRNVEVSRGVTEERLYAVIEFEPELVDSQLREAGLPLWSNNRPTILVWLTVEDLNGRRFATQESDPAIATAIIDSAKRRGLAVKLPAYDLEDTLAVSVDEAWQLSNYRMQVAAERYGADTVLLGRASQLSNGLWLGKWLYQQGTQRLDYDLEAGDIEQYIRSALDPVAEQLAAQYAIAPVNIADNGVLMRLTGIDSFVDYAQAIAYLESVAAIRHANVVDIQGDEIVLQLIADGMLSQLELVFKLDEKLQPATRLYQGGYHLSLDHHWP
jgi:hypothetical protein